MERKRSFGWVLATAGILWLAILLLVVGAAHAQMGGDIFSPRESGTPHGKYVIGWNTTGTEIAPGTLVMADTTGSGSVPQVVVGKGFKTWSGATADFWKIMGVLIDPCPGRAQARIMVKGFVPNAKLMSGLSAGSYLRPSFTAVGRFAAWAESDSERFYQSKACAVFERYARTDSSIGWVWVDFPVR